MRYLLLSLLSFGPLMSFSQSFRGETNDIHLDFSNPGIKTTLPVINWISPQQEYTNSSENRLTLDLLVKSEVPLRSIRLIVADEHKAKNEKEIEIGDDKNARHIVQALALPDGQHSITVEAVNSTGGIASSTRRIVIGMDAIADAISIDRKDNAILFATDKYDHWPDLVNPVEDANAIAEVLKSTYGFEIEVIENPTQEDVFIKLADYAQREYKPQDQLMIFFAGHGYFDEAFGEGFVVARNSLENDRAKTSYISHSRLRSVIDNINCAHIFLAMDVCFGGTFDPKIAKARGADAYAELNNSQFLVRKLSYKTRKYLTSGGKTYVSDGVPGKHSPFALKMLQALAGAGGADRILTLDEIKSSVEKLVPEPRFGSFGDDNPNSDFVFVAKGG